MAQVLCPFCNHRQEINHDDGYGYDEDVDYEQECSKCRQTFIFNTIISFDYDVYKNQQDKYEQNNFT